MYLKHWNAMSFFLKLLVDVISYHLILLLLLKTQKYYDFILVHNAYYKV